MIQLHTYVESRLQRWAAWNRETVKFGPQRVRSWWGPMVLDRNVGRQGVPNAVKYDPTECQQTDQAVYALEHKLREVIVEHWLRGGTVEQSMKRLNCGKQTYYNRLARANHELLGYLNDQAAGIPLPRPYVPETKRLTNVDGFRTFSATVV